MKEKLKNTRKYEIGTKVNYLTILDFIPPNKVSCVCVCGNIKEYFLSNITKKTGRYTSSCGCKRGELVSLKKSRHKLSGTKFYRKWRSMFDRMSDKYIDKSAYVGISISDAWKKFDNFKDDMYNSYLEHVEKHGERNTSLDRIDVFGDYRKENCRWATNEIQSLNKKNSLIVDWNNKKIPLKTLCKELGKNYGTVLVRYRLYDFSLEKSLFKEPWKKYE